MKRQPSIMKRTRFAATFLIAGSFLPQFLGFSCNDLQDLLNPCIVLATCTPEEFDILNNPIPDFENDPSCTIPGACGDPPFPTGPGPRPDGL